MQREREPRGRLPRSFSGCNLLLTAIVLPLDSVAMTLSIVVDDARYVDRLDRWVPIVGT